MNYKLVASDIDGTLLTKDGTLLPSTDTAIRRLVKSGILFATVSARTISHTRRAFPDLMGLCCANAYVNGAYVETSNEEILVDAPIRDEDLSMLIKELNGARVSFCCISKDDAVASLIHPEASKGFMRHHGGFTEKPIIESPGLRTYLIAAVAENLKPVIELIAEQQMDIEATPVIHSSLTDMKVSFFQRKGTNKATALRCIADAHGIEISDTIAIGDSLINDTPMIEAAGCGVAMKNAHERLREKSEYVTERDNDGDGVGEFLRDFFRLE